MATINRTAATTPETKNLVLEVSVGSKEGLAGGVVPLFNVEWELEGFR